jgi:hypothetical protein
LGGWISGCLIRIGFFNVSRKRSTTKSFLPNHNRYRERYTVTIYDATGIITAARAAYRAGKTVVTHVTAK